MSEFETLPRVTYSNVREDFSGVHRHIDKVMPGFEARLGKDTPNVIAGEENRDGVAYNVQAPFDSAIRLGTFYDASMAAISAAVAAARNAQTTWGRRPWQERISILRRVAAVLEARKFDLGIANLIEVGKSRFEAMGEVEEAIDLVRHFCADFETNQGFERSLARAASNERTVTVLKPYGVFAVIAPFNFPVALSLKMIVPAIVSGNCVVYKPSEGAGLTASMLMEALKAGGLPPGVVNMVCGEKAGPLLANANGIDAIAFTGSHDVGMSLFRKFALGPYMRPVLAEMGGKNPTYVTASADLDKAAEGVARSAFGLQGQKCSSCEVGYVDRLVYPAFVERLLSYTANLVIGDPRHKDTFVGPIISAEAYAKFERTVIEAREVGKILHGGRRLSGGLFDRGFYVEPTIVAELPRNHRLLTEELFLPFISLVIYDELPAAITEGNAVKYGLTAGAYAEDADDLDLFLSRAEAGVLYANRASGATTGAWPGFQTFAGWKGSGISGKGGFGPYDLPQFMREQSHTIMDRVGEPSKD
jgi:1-pyrroline-5-carboxylate dehydrogenase